MATAHKASKHHCHLENPLNARALRVESGVSIDSICERTKISRYFLEAIEERAYHRLPGGVFDINYIRQYSESVGFSADVLLADYRTVSQHLESVNCPPPADKLSQRWWRHLLMFFCA